MEDDPGAVAAEVRKISGGGNSTVDLRGGRACDGSGANRGGRLDVATVREGLDMAGVVAWEEEACRNSGGRIGVAEEEARRRSRAATRSAKVAARGVLQELDVGARTGDGEAADDKGCAVGGHSDEELDVPCAAVEDSRGYA